jgi:hypothetical protein
MVPLGFMTQAASVQPRRSRARRGRCAAILVGGKCTRYTKFGRLRVCTGLATPEPLLMRTGHLQLPERRAALKATIWWDAESRLLIVGVSRRSASRCGVMREHELRREGSGKTERGPLIVSGEHRSRRNARPQGAPHQALGAITRAAP